MDSLDLRSIEQAKISCAKILFENLFTIDIAYHKVDNYQTLMDLMNSL